MRRNLMTQREVISSSPNDSCEGLANLHYLEKIPGETTHFLKISDDSRKSKPYTLCGHLTDFDVFLKTDE